MIHSGEENIMKKTDAKKILTNIFKLTLPLLVLLLVQTSIKAQVPSNYELCAKEGERCQFTGTRTVRYGANGIWAETTATNGVTCGVAAFGRDPVPNVLKQCYLVAPVGAQAQVEKPINQYTYLGTHNAISSYAYGYNLQNSQRYDVTTQLNGGVRMLEIDIVYDNPDNKEPAGVYICHCGEAPHSNSSIELKRAQDKGMKSKVRLPNWSAGASYTRFSKILKEIDNWLIAHPNEIVFIMPENNSATVTQFDDEVKLAGLKTRTYVKPDDQKAWPTKPELIASNQRLIILAADGVDLTGSTLANKKGYIEWKGYITPQIKGSKNEYSTAVGDEDKFLTLGSFEDTFTDAVTSKYYNDYNELNKRKAEWIARRVTRFPTFIQVNQVQIGDALRFVNELNDARHQIASTFPKDPAGEWIVNTSATIATGVVNAANAADKAITNHITGGPTTPGSRSITFNNQAGYMAKMTVIYFMTETIGGVQVPMGKSLSTPAISLGFSRPLEIPRNTAKGMPISVVIEGIGTVKGKVLETTVAEGFNGNVCFKSWGTIFDAKGGLCQ
jgi:hypothetical protein